MKTNKSYRFMLRVEDAFSIKQAELAILTALARRQPDDVKITVKRFRYPHSGKK